MCFAPYEHCWTSVVNKLTLKARDVRTPLSLHFISSENKDSHKTKTKTIVEGPSEIVTWPGQSHSTPRPFFKLAFH